MEVDIPIPYWVSVDDINPAACPFQFFAASVVPADGLTIRPIIESLNTLELKSCTEAVMVKITGNCPIDDIDELRQKYPVQHVPGDLLSIKKGYIHFEVMTVSRSRKDIMVRYIREGGILIGAVVSGENIGTFLFVTGISGNGNGFQIQIHSIFETMARLLAEHQMSGRNLFRTWFYLGQIIRDYDAFNEVRNKTFDHWGIETYPASTAIGASLAFPKFVSSSFWAHNGLHLSGFGPIVSDMQCEAHVYGSRFSRAVLGNIDQMRMLAISGTSAVDVDGQSRFSDEIAEHVSLAVKSVDHLLTRAHMNWKHVVSSTIYFKSEGFLNEFRRIYAKRHLSFPFSYNLCDICRRDLSFEIECIALAT